MKRIVLSAAVVFAAIFSATDANAQNQFPPMFSNQTHSAEAQPFADLSQQIWDLMAAKDADALKEIFHPTFFVTQTFTREDGKWWMTAMVFTTRTAGPGIDPNAPSAH